MKRRLLVVDDEASVRDVVSEVLQRDFDVREAEDTATGLDALLDFAPDVLICDVVMPGGGGHELVRNAFRYLPDLAVVIITGHADISRFIEFFQLGVADFLPKPFDLQCIRDSVNRALATRQVRRLNASRRPGQPSDDPEPWRLLGESPVMRELRETVARVAPTDATLLLTGESGTGKEVLARQVHATSPRGRGPFVPIHCGALPSNLIESELFGHARGAFTGAEWPREGSFEAARDGTLFLDEVSTMPPEAQTKLLRVLQERVFRRVGESREREFSARVVAATNEDLGHLVAAGRFREDLLYRLEVFPITLPPLRERGADVLLLANVFLEEACHASGVQPAVLSSDAALSLLAHEWPGNVRELRNVIERAALLHSGSTVRAEDLLLFGGEELPATPLPEGGMDLRQHLEEMEQDLIHMALGRCDGSRTRAAKLLRIPRSTLVRRLDERTEFGGASN